MKAYIETYAWDAQTGSHVNPVFFVLETLTGAKYNRLRNYSNGQDYWFEGLDPDSGDWHHGGFYHGGLINKNIRKEMNVEGVVLDRRIWLLIDVTTEKPKRFGRLIRDF